MSSYQSQTKDVRFTLTWQQYAQALDFAKRQNLRNVASLTKRLLVETIEKKDPDYFFDMERAQKDGDIRNHVRSEEEITEDWNSSGKRVKPTLEYCKFGDRCYILWRQNGLRLPSLGLQDAFWIDESNTKGQHFKDITDTLSDFERKWTEAWAYNFDVLCPLWWMMIMIVSSEDRLPGIEDYEMVLKWFFDRKTPDDILEELKITKRKFVDLASEMGLDDIVIEKADGNTNERYNWVRKRRLKLVKEVRRLTAMQTRLAVQLGILKPNHLKL